MQPVDQRPAAATPAERCQVRRVQLEVDALGRVVAAHLRIGRLEPPARTIDPAQHRSLATGHQQHVLPRGRHPHDRPVAAGRRGHHHDNLNRPRPQRSMIEIGDAQAAPRRGQQRGRRQQRPWPPRDRDEQSQEGRSDRRSHQAGKGSQDDPGRRFTTRHARSGRPSWPARSHSPDPARRATGSLRAASGSR